MDATAAAMEKAKKSDSSKKKKKKTPKQRMGEVQPVMREGSHETAVLCLAWNRNHESLLASGSADTTVKLWDVNEAACKMTYTHHKREVQAVAWNPVESTVLLSGSMDGAVAVLDARQTEVATTWNLPSEVE